MLRACPWGTLPKKPLSAPSSRYLSLLPPPRPIRSRGVLVSQSSVRACTRKGVARSQGRVQSSHNTHARMLFALWRWSHFWSARLEWQKESLRGTKEPDAKHGRCEWH